MGNTVQNVNGFDYRNDKSSSRSTSNPPQPPSQPPSIDNIRKRTRSFNSYDQKRRREETLSKFIGEYMHKVTQIIISGRRISCKNSGF